MPCEHTVSGIAGDPVWASGAPSSGHSTADLWQSGRV